MYRLDIVRLWLGEGTMALFYVDLNQTIVVVRLAIIWYFFVSRRQTNECAAEIFHV